MSFLNVFGQVFNYQAKAKTQTQAKTQASLDKPKPLKKLSDTGFTDLSKLEINEDDPSTSHSGHQAHEDKPSQSNSGHKCPNSAGIRYGTNVSAELKGHTAQAKFAGAEINVDSSLRARAGLSSTVEVSPGTLNAKAGAAAIVKAKGPTATASVESDGVKVNLSVQPVAQAGAAANTGMHSYFGEEERSFGVGSSSFVGARAGLEVKAGFSTPPVSLKVSATPALQAGISQNFGFGFKDDPDQFNFSLTGFGAGFVIGGSSQIDLSLKKQEVATRLERLWSFLNGDPKPWPPDRV